MRPEGLIVAGPAGAEALGAGVEGAREDEGAGGWLLTLGIVARQQRVVGRVVEGHAVGVVDVAVLPAVVVDAVLGHRHLDAVEDGRLVHVVPDEGVAHAAREAVVTEQRLPPLARRGQEAVDPQRLAWPAVALPRRGGLLVLDREVLGRQLLVHAVPVELLDVRVDDGDELARALVELRLHADGVRERQRIPREVLLVVEVVNVKPDDVVGDVVLVELAVDAAYVLVRHVVPAALVVRNGELLRQLRVAR